MTKALKPIGLKPAASHAPRHLRSTEDVITLQRFMMHALVRPLAPDERLQDTWIDGRPMEVVASEFIKPNDRLTSLERLEIYGRTYWFRLTENFTRDCPGLRAFLGEERFNRVCTAYLSRYPSRSFTLRNLCQRLVKFLTETPELTAPDTALALEIARFEWAQTVAFDGPSLPKPTGEELRAIAPSRLKLRLQPFVTLLHLSHAVDNYVIAVAKRDALRGDASNAAVEAAPSSAPKKVRPPKKGEIWVAVHRQDNRLYYKRLEPEAFRVLQALEAGRTVPAALAKAGPSITAAKVQAWFSTWMALGWFALRK